MFITSLPLPLFHHLVYNSPWHGMAHIIDLFVFIFKATHLLYTLHTSSCPKPEQELLNNITHSMLAGKSDEAFSLWWHFYTPARLRKLFHLRKVTAINNILGQRESSRRLCSNDGPRNSETLTKLKYTLNFARPLRSLARKVRNRKWEVLDEKGMIITLLDPVYFGPFKTRGGADLPPKLFPFFLNSWRDWFAQKWVHN